MSYKYDPVNKILVKTKDSNWHDVYKEFDKIVDKYFPNERKIEAEIKALYMKHKGDPAWDEAYRRWMDSPTNDSKTVDSKTTDSDPVATLQNFRKHAEYGDSFKLDIKGEKAIVQKEADGWYISYKGRKNKGPYKIIEASVKEFMKDSKTADADVDGMFSSVNRKYIGELNQYRRRIREAKTAEECERLNESIRQYKGYLMDEYLEVWNQVGKYAQDKRNEVSQRYSELGQEAFKKYQELRKAGK